MNLLERARNLSNSVPNNETVDMMLSITAETYGVINTTIYPLLPNDVPVILDIMNTVLGYVYITM